MAETTKVYLKALHKARRIKKKKKPYYVWEKDGLDKGEVMAESQTGGRDADEFRTEESMREELEYENDNY